MEVFSWGKNCDQLDTICHACCLVLQFDLLLFRQQGCSKNFCYDQSFEKVIASLYTYCIYIQSELTGWDISKCLGNILPFPFFDKWLTS